MLRFLWVTIATVVLGLAHNIFPVFAADGITNRSSGTSFADEKIITERVLEEKTQSLLDSLIGRGRSQISVTVSLNRTQKEELTVKPVSGVSADKNSAYLWQDPKEANSAILPGFLDDSGIPKPVPAPKTPMNISRSYSPPGALVHKVDALLLIDRSVSKEKLNDAEKCVAQVLGISPKRGDTFVIVPTNLTSGWRQVLLTPDYQYRLLTVGLIVAVLLVGFVLLYLGLAGLAKAVVSSAGTREATEHNTTTIATIASPKEENTLTDKTKNENLLTDDKKDSLQNNSNDTSMAPTLDGELAFGFINEKNLSMSIEFLKKEPARNISLVLATSSADRANHILEKLPARLRADVVKLFGQPLTDIAELRSDMIQRMKSFLEGSIDASAHFRKIFAVSRPDVQKTILADLRAGDPDLAEIFEKSILRFEDLPDLEESIRIQILTSVPTETAAAAVRSLDKTIQVRLLSGMPEGLNKRISQSIELSELVTPDQEMRARATIMSVVFDLIQQGRIQFNSSDQSRNMPTTKEKK